MGANLRNASGLFLIAVGLVAMPLPLLPGIPLVAAGVAILGSDHPLVRFCTSWFRDRGFLKQRESSKVESVDRDAGPA